MDTRSSNTSEIDQRDKHYPTALRKGPWGFIIVKEGRMEENIIEALERELQKNKFFRVTITREIKEDSERVGDPLTGEEETLWTDYILQKIVVREVSVDTSPLERAYEELVKIKNLLRRNGSLLRMATGETVAEFIDTNEREQLSDNVIMRQGQEVYKDFKRLKPRDNLLYPQGDFLVSIRTGMKKKVGKKDNFPDGSIPYTKIKNCNLEDNEIFLQLFKEIDESKEKQASKENDSPFACL